MKKFKVFKMVFALLLGFSTMLPITKVNAEEPNNELGDGVYTVKANVWHATNDAASMSSAVLKEEAKLVVKNGEYKIYLTFQTMSMGSIKADLDKLTVHPSLDDANNKNNAIEGTVESERVVDGVNKPEVVSFTLLEPASVYTYVRLYYMGNDGSTARIKINYDGLIKTIDTASLTSKIADAKAIKADKYTEESYATLQTAITAAEAVLSSKDATQEQVNEQVTALEKAISNLVLMDNGEDDTLKDGIYEVPVALWNATLDKPSMAAAGVNSTARIIVKDGMAKMYIYTQLMKFGTITATLQELKIVTLTRTTTVADIETRDASGNPTSFSFVLPHFEQYIDVLVNPHVDIMGNQDIAARLKVDYDNMKVVNDATDVSKAPSTSNTTTPTTTTPPTQTVPTADTVSTAPYIMLGLLVVVVGIFTKKNRVYE